MAINVYFAELALELVMNTKVYKFWALQTEEVKLLLNLWQEDRSETANVSIAAGEFKRGELLAETGGLYDSATGSDSLKPLAIASSDIDSDDSRIATVYKTGEFNYSAIIAGSDVSLNAFEEQLRKDGIILTDIKGG